MLLLYTSFFSLPFIGFLAYSYYSNSSFMAHRILNIFVVSDLLVFITFLTFAVKLPVYGLHF